MYLSADSALLIAETKNQMECLANQPLSLGGGLVVLPFHQWIMK